MNFFKIHKKIVNNNKTSYYDSIPSKIFNKAILYLFLVFFNKKIIKTIIFWFLKIFEISYIHLYLTNLFIKIKSIPSKYIKLDDFIFK